MKSTLTLTVSLLLILCASSARALTFKPREAHLWDTWLFYQDGTWHLYYLIASEWKEWDGVGVATSQDGVHWEERGTPIMKRDDAVWLGTGSTWRSPLFAKDGRFICNFSEQPRGEAQHIYFAESRDLLKWDRLPVEFRQDPRWYEEKGRWDCIYTVPRPGGGFFGYWTATPKGRVGFGFGESQDGVNWTALPAPGLDWRTNAAPKSCEIGAVEKIGGRYYAMVGHPSKMFMFVGDKPEGPFLASEKNFEVLKGDCYFARFFPSPDGMLVTHHSITRTKKVRKEVCYAAPLKRADVDGEGTLRLMWWRGNEALKGQAINPRIKNGGDAAAPAFLETAVNVCRGTMFEGLVTFPEKSAAPRPGVVIGCGEGPAGAIQFLSSCATTGGTVQPDGTAFTPIPKQANDRQLPLKTQSRFRLLIRHSLAELYLDDVLMNVMSLPRDADGRIGFLNGGAGMSDLKVWTMTLPDEAPPSVAPAAASGETPLLDKTLVAWAAPSHLDQRGGAALSLQDSDEHFDAIVFGELAPGKWMAGSDHFRRTLRTQDSVPAETADAKTLVQIAIVYRAMEVTVYRNGQQYSRHTIAAPQPFGSDSLVLIGPRAEGAEHQGFVGEVDDARIYASALSAEQIAALKPNEEGPVKPWAWWAFDEAATADRMGRLPHSKLSGGASVKDGRLMLSRQGANFSAQRKKGRGN